MDLECNDASFFQVLYLKLLEYKDCDSIHYNECTIDRSNFRKLLCSAVEDNHFIFNGKLYGQLDGVAMGSPLGPTLANIFMCALETRYLNECPPDFKPVLYRRFVDDTFCLFENPEHVNRFLEFINRFHPNVNFTVEVENDSTLPFLDVSIFKNNNEFSTSLYRKKTFTGQYTDFARLSPKKYETIWSVFLSIVLFIFALRMKIFTKSSVKLKLSSIKTAFQNL